MRQEIITILVVAGTALFGYLDSRSKRKSKSSPTSSGNASAMRQRQLRIPPVPQSSATPARHTPTISLPDEGVRVTADLKNQTPGTDLARHPSAPAVPDYVAEHRMRWRKAMIDSEILKTKF